MKITARIGSHRRGGMVAAAVAFHILLGEENKAETRPATLDGRDCQEGVFRTAASAVLRCLRGR